MLFIYRKRKPHKKGPKKWGKPKKKRSLNKKKGPSKKGSLERKTIKKILTPKEENFRNSHQRKESHKKGP